MIDNNNIALLDGIEVDINGNVKKEGKWETSQNIRF